jgi:hypothetical protein
MAIKVNDVEMSEEEALKVLSDESTVVTKVSMDIDNPNKLRSDPPNMDGFDIPRDLLVSMAQESDNVNGGVTLTFSNCGKLGGKTLVITVKDTEEKTNPPTSE